VCGFCAASFTGAANLPRTAPTMGGRLVPEKAIAGFSSVTISGSGPVAQSVEQRIENYPGNGNHQHFQLVKPA